MNLPERKRQNGVYWVKRRDIDFGYTMGSCYTAAKQMRRRLNTKGS